MRQLEIHKPKKIISSIVKRLWKLFLFSFVLFAFIYLVVVSYAGANVYLDNRKKSDAIIVLGAKSYKGKVYNPCLAARVEHAVGLYDKGFAGKLIMSGGDDVEDKTNEAETMSKIAQDYGVDAKDIILEKKSRSTYENIVLSKRIMNDKNIKTAIIVTEPFHSPRAALIAKKAGLDFSVSPTKTSQCWLRWKFGSRYFLREPFAIIAYFLQGKL